jgi:hypothetical protein
MEESIENNSKKNDFFTETNSATMSIANDSELDGYDLIDFSLLDDGFSVVQEENNYELQQELIDDTTITISKFETIPELEKMTKSDDFLRKEIIDSLFTIYNKKHFVETVANGFYDKKVKNNGLVKIWENKQKQKKQVFSYKPFVNNLLGTRNTSSNISNAVTKDWFVPIFTEEKRVFDVIGRPGFINTPVKVLEDVSGKLSYNKGYGNLRSDIKEIEDPAYVNLIINGLTITFSNEVKKYSDEYDNDVLSYNTYEGITYSKDLLKINNVDHYMINNHKISNSVRRVILDSISSQGEYKTEKDDIIISETKNIVGFMKYGKKKNMKIYKVDLENNLQKVKKLKGTKSKLYLFENLTSVEQYAKMLDYITPDIQSLFGNYKTIESISKALEKYSWTLDNISKEDYEKLKILLVTGYENIIKKKVIDYSLLSKNFIHDKNGVLFNLEKIEFLQKYYNTDVESNENLFSWLITKEDNGMILIDPNSEIFKRTFNSKSTFKKMKKDYQNMKYFMLQKENIRDKISQSTDDKTLQKELFSQYIKNHGTLSKLSNTVLDQQGNFICCSHHYDILINNIDMEGIILNYGIKFRGVFICKYCGENIHTDYDEGPSFNEDGNVMVMHGQIEVEEEFVENLKVSDEMNGFIKLMNMLVNVALTSSNYTQKKINYKNISSMFINEMNDYYKKTPQLANIFNIDTVRKELNMEAEYMYLAIQKRNTQGRKISKDKIIIEKYSIYISSLLFYRIGLFVSVMMLQFQLSNPELFELTKDDYTNSIINLFTKQNILVEVGNYLNNNSIDQERFYQNGADYYPFFTKKDTVKTTPFNGSMKIVSILTSVAYDNYSLLSQKYKPDIILAKFSVKNSNVVLQKNMAQYGSVLSTIVGLKNSDSIGNIMQNVMVTASDYIKSIVDEYKKYNSNSDIDNSLKISIDISNEKDKKPRKDFDTVKHEMYKDTPLIEDLKNIEKATKPFNAFLTQNNTIRYKHGVTKQSDVNPSLMKKESFSMVKIKSKKIVVKEEVNDSCDDSDSMESLLTKIVDFITSNISAILESNKFLHSEEIIKYWFPEGGIFKTEYFTNLVLFSLKTMSETKINENIYDIEYSDSMKIREYSDYYINQESSKIKNIVSSDNYYYYENYLRKGVIKYANCVIGELEDDKEMTLDLLLCDSEFLKYEKLEYNASDNVICAMLKEIVHNINILNTISSKYALVLLKIFYYINMSVVLRNKTMKSIDVTYDEIKRKQFINLRNAIKRSEAETIVVEEEQDDLTGDLPDLLDLREEENYNNIAVDIVDDSNGSYQVD